MPSVPKGKKKTEEGLRTGGRKHKDDIASGTVAFVAQNTRSSFVFPRTKPQPSLCFSDPIAHPFACATFHVHFLSYTLPVPLRISLFPQPVDPFAWQANTPSTYAVHPMCSLPLFLLAHQPLVKPARYNWGCRVIDFLFGTGLGKRLCWWAKRAGGRSMGHVRCRQLGVRSH